ncbi:UNVERIFIED_CONTAM: hypothetical protein FKN15_050795 [Acipenser sinensis]
MINSVAIVRLEESDTESCMEEETSTVETSLGQQERCRYWLSFKENDVCLLKRWLKINDQQKELGRVLWEQLDQISTE